MELFDVVPDYLQEIMTPSTCLSSALFRCRLCAEATSWVLKKSFRSLVGTQYLWPPVGTCLEYWASKSVKFVLGMCVSLHRHVRVGLVS